jgi:hypothetical protein
LSDFIYVAPDNEEMDYDNKYVNYDNETSKTLIKLIVENDYYLSFLSIRKKWFLFFIRFCVFLT